MHKNSITIREIEDYLAGELSPEHVAEFEKRLEEDDNAKRDLMELKKVIEGIKGFAFRQTLKKFHDKHFPPEAVEE